MKKSDSTVTRTIKQGAVLHVKTRFGWAMQHVLIESTHAGTIEGGYFHFSYVNQRINKKLECKVDILSLKDEETQSNG